VLTYAQTLYVEAKLNAGQQLEVPHAPERAIYVVSGSLIIENETVAQHHMAVLESDVNIIVKAVEETRIAIIGGEALGHRFIEWNFVSSRKERIEQAKADWQAGRFAKIPGDDKEFIPLP
jgi:redox-sensitive bicupin YhaK (pirin superfamily)